MKRLSWTVLGLCLAVNASEGATGGPSSINTSNLGSNTLQVVIARSSTSGFSANVLDTAIVDLRDARWTQVGTDSTGKVLLPVSVTSIAQNASGTDSASVTIDMGAVGDGTFTNDIGGFLVISGTRTVKVGDVFGRYARVIVKNKEAGVAKYKIVLTFPK